MLRRTVLLLALAGCAAPSSGGAAARVGRSEAAESATAASLVTEVNRARSREDLPALRTSDALDDAARQRARAIAARPSGRRMSGPGHFGEVLRAHGIRKYDDAHEFLAILEDEEDPARAALETWRSYSSAWDHVLDPATTSIGVGVARGGDGALVVVGLLLAQAPERDLEAMELEIEKAVNRVRAEHGLRTLSPLPELIEAARRHSEDMAGRDFFDHRSPEGMRPIDRVRARGVAPRRVLENISLNRGQTEPVTAAVEGWIASPGHRRNILDPDVTHTGVGVAEDDDGAFYFTQLFVLPAPDAGR